MSTFVEPVPRRRLAERVRYWLPAVVVFALGIVAWQWLLPDALHVESYLLPRLSDVLGGVRDERGELAQGAWITFKEAVGGFVLGSAAGFAAALVLARWRPFGDALMPYMIAANAIPIIAFAPITNAWFGILSPWSKIVDRSGALLLPCAREHAARTDVGESGVDRAHALVRGPGASSLPAGADPEFAAVRLLRLEGGVCPCDDRRSRGRLLRWFDGGAGRSDPELGRALPLRRRLGGDPRRERARASRSTPRSHWPSGMH